MAAKDRTYFIGEFKRIHEEKNGIILSDEDAIEAFEKLVALFSVIYKPLPNSSKALAKK